MHLSGTNLTYTKAYNYRIVFETIRLNKSISRADIARKTNLTAQTISNIVTRLLQNGIVKEGEKFQNKRGAPSVTLEINPKGAYSIGLDLNRDHLTGILIDLEGTIISRVFYEIKNPTSEHALNLMIDSYARLISNINITKTTLCGLGISLPGPFVIDKNENLVSAINPKDFPEWDDFALQSALNQKIDSSIFIENNASAAAIAEVWYGAGKTTDTFLYAFLGAGLGGGLVLNGSLFEGENRNAGEFGYLPFLGEKSPLSNSKQPHIGEHFNLNNLYTWLHNSDITISGLEDLELLFIEENPAFMHWLSLAKQYLAAVFIISESILDIDVIILGGRYPQVIIEHISKSLPEIMSSLRNDRKILSPTFKCGTAGIDAAALGAATLPMFDLFAAQSEILKKNNTSH